ncbi:hypothetical protein [Catenulispora sp. MAP5-51]
MDQYVKDFEPPDPTDPPDAPDDVLLEQAGTVAAMTSAAAVTAMFRL